MNLGARRLLVAACAGLLSPLATLLSTGCLTTPLSGEPEPKPDEIVNAQLAIAESQLNQGQPEKAIQTLRPLVSTFPDRNRVLTLNGMAHLALSNPDQALIFLRRAYDQDPSVSAGLNLSSALIAAHQGEKARNVLRKLIKRADDYQFPERLYHNFGVSFQKERNFPAARKYFLQALQINPTYYMSLFALAKVYKETGNQTEAKAQLRKAVKACPSCYESVHLLATAQINDREEEDAMALLKNFSANADAAAEDRESSAKFLEYLQNRHAPGPLSTQGRGQRPREKVGSPVAAGPAIRKPI